MVFFRNVQFRWMPLKGRNAVTIASNVPAQVAIRESFRSHRAARHQGKFDLPDLSGNVRFTRDWGYFQAAGMLRRIKWVDTIDDAFDLGGTEVGARPEPDVKRQVHAERHWPVRVRDRTGNPELARTTHRSTSVSRSLGGDPRRPIKGVALPMWSMVAFLDHNWSKRFSTAIGYSFMDIDNSMDRRRTRTTAVITVSATCSSIQLTT